MLQIWDLVSKELHGKGTKLPLLEMIFSDKLSAVQVSNSQDATSINLFLL